MRHTTNIKFHNFIPFVTIIIYTKGKKNMEQNHHFYRRFRRRPSPSSFMKFIFKADVYRISLIVHSFIVRCSADERKDRIAAVIASIDCTV